MNEAKNPMINKKEKFKEIAKTVVNVIKIYSLNSQREIDQKFKLQLANSIYLLTNIYVLVYTVADHPVQEEVSDELFEAQIIIGQVCNSMLAALQLIRQGYPLEPQFLMRSAIESLALAISFNLDSDKYKKYREGRLSGEKCISSAKEIIEEIGQVYGLLSQVTHPSVKTTGNNYTDKSKSIIIGGGYTSELSHRTLFNFAVLNYLLLTIWKGSEYIFLKFENDPKFWIWKNNRYVSTFDDDIKQVANSIRNDFMNAISSTANVE